MTVNYSSNLLKNVHENLASPDSGETFLVQGDYDYWHYGCDGFNDRVIIINWDIIIAIKTFFYVLNHQNKYIYIYSGLGVRIQDTANHLFMDYK